MWNSVSKPPSASAAASTVSLTFTPSVTSHSKLNALPPRSSTILWVFSSPLMSISATLPPSSAMRFAVA